MTKWTPTSGSFSHLYGIGLIDEGETVPTLELISKEKNGFGDTYYYIRNSNGVTSKYEGDLDAYLKKNGAMR